MQVEIDATEVREYATELLQVDAALARHVKPAVAKAGVKMKEHMRDDFGKSTWFGHIAPTVSFDLIDNGFGVEVGPTKPRGALANIAIWGGASGGGGTVADPRGALEAEIEPFSKAVADAVAELLR